MIVIYEAKIINFFLIEQHKLKTFRELNLKKKVDKTFIIQDKPKYTDIDLINLFLDNKKKSKPSNADEKYIPR